MESKFKVGDRVRVKPISKGGTPGSVGVVKEILARVGWPVRVSFHDGGVFCTYRDDQLELVPPVVRPVPHYGDLQVGDRVIHGIQPATVINSRYPTSENTVAIRYDGSVTGDFATVRKAELEKLVPTAHQKQVMTGAKFAEAVRQDYLAAAGVDLAKPGGEKTVIFRPSALPAAERRIADLEKREGSLMWRIAELTNERAAYGRAWVQRIDELEEELRAKGEQLDLQKKLASERDFINACGHRRIVELEKNLERSAETNAELLREVRELESGLRGKDEQLGIHRRLADKRIGELVDERDAARQEARDLAASARQTIAEHQKESMRRIDERNSAVAKLAVENARLRAANG